MMTAGLMAQTDITPKRFIFADQPVGKFEINGWNNGWGPQGGAGEAFENSKLMEGGGYVNLTGGGVWSAADKTATQATIDFQSGFNIYDFGGKVGKVLVYKGKNCTTEFMANVPAAKGTVPVARPQIGFFPDFTQVETGSDAEGDEKVAPFIRASVLYRAISNEAFATTNGGVLEIEAKTATGTPFTISVASSIPNQDMMFDSETDEDYTIEQGWARFEFDFQIGLPKGSPFAFSLKLSNVKEKDAPMGWLDGGAVLIKEIKFTQGTDGAYPMATPHIEKYIDLGKITGITSVNGENSEPCCVVSDGVLSVSNVVAGDKIEVYNTLGMKVASEVATADHATLSLAGNGLYIVSVNGKKSVKVFNN